MKTTKQKIVLALKITFVVLVLAVGLLFVFRNSLLQKAIAKIQTKLDTEYQCQFSVKKASFEGITGVVLEDILLLPKNADTLLSVKKIKTNYSFFQLLTGDIQLNNLEMNDGFIQLVKNKKGRNFDAFLKRDAKEIKTSGKRDYAETAGRVWSLHQQPGRPALATGSSGWQR